MLTDKSPSKMLPPCAVLSPIRAAGCPPIITVDEPVMITSDGPEQPAMSPNLAAGCPPIITVVQPGGMMGPPTWGLGDGMGQACMSPTRAAAGMMYSSLSVDVDHGR